MARLVAVDYDPFASQSAQPRLTPVDYDPFAPTLRANASGSAGVEAPKSAWIDETMGQYTRDRAGIDRLHEEAKAAGVPLGRAVKWKRNQLERQDREGVLQAPTTVPLSLGDANESSVNERAAIIRAAEQIQSSPLATWPNTGSKTSIPGEGDDAELTSALDVLENYRKRVSPEVPGPQFMRQMFPRGTAQEVATDPDGSWGAAGESMLQGVRQSVAGGAQALGEKLRYAGNYAPAVRGLLDAPANALRTEGYEQGVASLDRMSELGAGLAQRPTGSVYDDPDGWARYLGQQGVAGSGPTLVGMGAGLVNPVLGAATFMGSAAGSEYGRARIEDNATPSEASVRAVTAAATEGIPEAIGGAAMLGRLPLMKLAQSTARGRAAIAMPVEAGTEALTEKANIELERARGKYISPEEESRRIQDAAVIGGVMGGTIGAGTAVAEGGASGLLNIRETIRQANSAADISSPMAAAFTRAAQQTTARILTPNASPDAVAGAQIADDAFRAAGVGTVAASDMAEQDALSRDLDAAQRDQLSSEAEIDRLLTGGINGEAQRPVQAQAQPSNGRTVLDGQDAGRAGAAIPGISGSLPAGVRTSYPGDSAESGSSVGFVGDGSLGSRNAPAPQQFTELADGSIFIPGDPVLMRQKLADAGVKSSGVIREMGGLQGVRFGRNVAGEVLGVVGGNQFNGGSESQAGGRFDVQAGRQSVDAGGQVPATGGVADAGRIDAVSGRVAPPPAGQPTQAAVAVDGPLPGNNRRSDGAIQPAESGNAGAGILGPIEGGARAQSGATPSADVGVAELASAPPALRDLTDDERNFWPALTAEIRASVDNPGGRMIVNNDGSVGRTKWADLGPVSGFWRGRPKGWNSDDVLTALDRASAGEKLTAKQKNIVEYAKSWARDYSAEHKSQLLVHEQDSRLAEREAIRDDIESSLPPVADTSPQQRASVVSLGHDYTAKLIELKRARAAGALNPDQQEAYIDLLEQDRETGKVAGRPMVGIGNKTAYVDALMQGKLMPVQVFLDADNFKALNDKFGHDVGDDAIRLIADVVRAEFGDGNVFHRGGDEFLTQGMTQEEVDAKMARVQSVLANYAVDLPLSDGRTATLPGIGVSYGTGANEKAADDSLKQDKQRRKEAGLRFDRREGDGVGRVGSGADGARTDASGTDANPQDRPDAAAEGVGDDRQDRANPPDAGSPREVAGKRGDTERASDDLGGSGPRAEAVRGGQTGGSEVSGGTARGSVDTIRAAISAALGPKFLARLDNQRWFQIVDTVADLPPDVRKSITGEGVAGFVLPDGRVFIVAEGAAANPVGVTLHELGVHYGMTGILGEDFAPTLAKFKRLRAKDDRVGRAYERATEAADKDANGELTEAAKATLDEEALAYFVEENWDSPDTRGIVYKVIDAIKRLLNRLGMPLSMVNASPELLREVAIGAARMAADGRISVGKDGKLKYHRAFHGSPHDFDKFRLDDSTIGTGEGAQAFGFGLYFAGRKELGEHYRKQLSISQQTLKDLASPYDDAGYSDEEAITKLRRAADVARRNERNGEAADYDETARWIESGRPANFGGRLYEVELAPTEDQYLDWDAPLSEQSQKVQQSVYNLLTDLGMAPTVANYYANSKSGADVYREISKLTGSDKAASARLKSERVPGIRYLDGSSRGAGGHVVTLSTSKNPNYSTTKFQTKQQAEDYAAERRADGFTATVEIDGSRNYVIFDDSSVKVVAKYSRKADGGSVGGMKTLADLRPEITDAEADGRVTVGKDGGLVYARDLLGEAPSETAQLVAQWKAKVDAKLRGDGRAYVKPSEGPGDLFGGPAEETSDLFAKPQQRAQGTLFSRKRDNSTAAEDRALDRGNLEEAIRIGKRRIAEQREALGDISNGVILKMDGRDSWAIVMPDVEGGGKWRMQMFDRRGFVGHRTRNSRDAALDEALQDKYTTRDDGALDEIQDSPEFVRGNFIAGEMMQLNAGKITSAEFDKRIADYDSSVKVVAKYSRKADGGGVGGVNRAKVELTEKVPEHVGYQSWEITDDYDGEGSDADKYALINMISVRKQYRRQGYARRLVREAVAEIRAEHPDITIKLAANPQFSPGDERMDTDELVAFYETEGFTPVESDGAPFVVMEYDDSFKPNDTRQAPPREGLGTSGADARIAYSRKTPAEARAESAQKQADLGAQLVVSPGQSFVYTDKFTDDWRGQTRKMRERIQDKLLSVRDAQKDIEKIRGAIEDAANVYRRENLMHGRVGDQRDKLQDNHIRPLIEAMAEAKVSPALLEDYLEARHAKERNEKIAATKGGMPDGAAGMTTAQAEDFLQGRAAGHRSGVTLDPAMTRQVSRLARKVYAVTAETRRRLLDSGQITQEAFDALENAYAAYVPLRGKDGTEGGKGRGTGKGIDVRGKPVLRAAGRGEGNRAQNILAEVIADAERSIINAEKLRVGRTLARLVLENPNPDVWAIEPVKTELKVSEGTPEEIYEAVKNLDQEEGTIIVKVKGKPYRIVIEDRRMAEALKNMAVETVPEVIQYVAGLNRYFSAVLTRYNPSFVGVNMTRDLLFGMTGIWAEHGAAAAAKAAASYVPAMRAAWRDIQGKPPVNAMGRYAREFAEAGGKTYFGKLENVSDMSQRIGEEFKTFRQMAMPKFLGGEMSPVRALAKVARDSKMVQAIEAVNDTVENTLRLSVYAARREAGASIEQAAEYAKNISVNFNRRGSATSWLNALYLFFNAATQGAHRTLTLLKNPKVQGVLGGLAALQATSAMFLMGLDDDDGEPLWDSISPWDKQRNLILAIPIKRENGWGATVIKIPMPYGFNLFPYMGGRTVQLFRDAQEKPVARAFADYTVDAVVGVAQAMSPIPFDDGWKAALPHWVRIFTVLAENKDDLGIPVRQGDQNDDYDKPRSASGRDDTPLPFKIAATALNRAGLGDDYTPPYMKFMLDWAPEDLAYLFKTFAGGLGSNVVKSGTLTEKLIAGVPVNFKDVPVLSSFVSNVDQRQATSTRYYDHKDDIEREVARQRDIAKKTGEVGDNPMGIKIARNKSGSKIKRGEGYELEGASGSLFDTYKESEKEISRIRDEMRAAFNDQSISYTERIRKIDELKSEREEVQRELNAAWREQRKKRTQ